MYVVIILCFTALQHNEEYQSNNSITSWQLKYLLLLSVVLTTYLGQILPSNVIGLPSPVSREASRVQSISLNPFTQTCSTLAYSKGRSTRQSEARKEIN